MDIYDPTLWNDDGSPRRPGVPAIGADTPFLDFVTESEIEEALAEPTEEAAQQFTDAFLKKLRMEARTNTPPSTGDVVHLWTQDGCWAAIITATSVLETQPDHLHVMPPGGPCMDARASHDERKTELDTWHWPEND